MSCAKHILCGRCGREVFHAERKIALNKVWHSFCFSCAKCYKLLDSCGVNPFEGELYCDNCYYEVTNGNIDQTFGDETKSSSRSREKSRSGHETYNRSSRDGTYKTETFKTSYRDSTRGSPRMASTPYPRGSSEYSNKESTRHRTGSSRNASNRMNETTRSNVADYNNVANLSEYVARYPGSEKELQSQNLMAPSNGNDSTMYKTVLSITPAQLQSEQRDFTSKDATFYRSFPADSSPKVENPGSRLTNNKNYSRNESSRFDSTGISSPASSRNRSTTLDESSRFNTTMSGRNDSYMQDETSGYDSTGISSPMSSRNRSSRYESTDLSRTTNDGTFKSLTPDRTFASSYKSARSGERAPDDTFKSSYRTAKGEESARFPPADRTFKGSYKLSRRDDSSKVPSPHGTYTIDERSRTQTPGRSLRSTIPDENLTFSPAVASSPISSKEGSRRTSMETSRERTRSPMKSRDAYERSVESSRRTGDFRDVRETRDIPTKGDFCNYPKCPKKCQGCACQHELPETESNVDLVDNPEDIVLCTPGDCNIPTPREVSTYYNRRFLDRLCNSCFPNYDENQIEREICRRCRRRVYIMEKQVAAGGVFHDCCFNCFMCRKPLNSLLLFCRRGEIYCNRCYTRYFGPKVYGHGFLPSLDP